MWGNFMNIFFDGTLEESSERQVRKLLLVSSKKVVQLPSPSLKNTRKI